MEPQHVDRRPGAANMEGEQYEVGMATLLFLRGYFQTSDFSLNVNVDGAGAFDDVILNYRQQSGTRCKAYMQLKHKKKPELKSINTLALCAKSGDYSLIHYFDSFCQIRQRYGVKDTDQFVIYTNAGLGNINGVQIMDADSLLDTGGAIISLAETEEQKTALKILEAYKTVLNDVSIHEQYTEKEIKQKLTPFAELSNCKRLLKALEGKKVSTKDRMTHFHALLQQQILDELNSQVWQSFISKLRLFVCQVSVKDLDNLIKETLRNYVGNDKLFLQLKYEMTEWWSNGDVTLSHKHAPFWVSAINDLISDLEAPVINRLSPVSEIVFTEKLQLSAKVSQIVTEGCTELSCLQVQQSLKDVGHFIVDSNTLASRTDEVLLKWRFLDWCRVLVVEGSLDNLVMSTEKINILMSKVCDILQSTEKRIVSISNTCAEIFIANLSKKFKIQVHHENFNLNLLDEKSIVRILGCEVDFQGIPVKLGTLAYSPSTKKAVTANLLLELLSKEGPIKIGKCLPKPGPNYVARTLYRKEYVRSNILQDNVFPKLAVSGLSKEQLHQLIGFGDKIEQFNENINSVDNSSRYFIIKGAEDFNYLCKKYNEDIHWIHWSEGRFVWMYSNGPLKPIVENLDDVEVKYDKIESFVNLLHKVVLILGEPGMGKSEELKSLATKLKLLDESTWVVTVVLNDYTAYLSKDQIDVTELLLKASNIKSQIGRKLFNYQLEFGGNIIVLFDGLDEINPKYTEKVNSIIEYLLAKKVRKIWLTSRPIMWGVLEKQFRVLPFRLLPLTKNEQINLLPKLWKYTASSENEQSEFEKNAKIFAEKLIKLTDTTLKDSLNLLGIPLHLILLAEVLKNQIVEFCKNGERDLPRRLDLLNLYSEFVDSKWNLYYDKIKLDRTVPGIDKLCEPAKLLTQDDVMNSAMVTLLNEDINQLSNAEEILKKNSNFIAKLDSGEEMVGLVTHVQNGKAVFVHRTFAEYFAAIWFSKNYLSNLDYFRKFYLSGSFETIRMFFDRILAHENVLHSYVLNCNIDDIRNLLADNNAVIDDLDRGGRTALHLAVANFLNLLFNRQVTTKINIGHLHFDLVNLPILVRQGSNKNVTYLLQIVELLLKKGADCSNIDNILSWTPVQFAENTGIWCLLDLLLEYYSVSPGDLSVIQDKILDQNFVTNVLEAAAVDECMNLMRLMFDYGACDSTFCCFSYKRTLLHVAAFLGHLKLTQFLIERGSDLEARDIFGLTALMASYVNDNQNVTIMLLQHGANPNAMCKDGNCVIHFAFRWTIQKFSKFSSDVEKNNEDNTEHLKSFFSKTKENTVLNLLEHGANPNAVDGLGNSLMDYAVGADLPNIVKLLQEFGCDINGCDYEQGTPLIKAIKWGNEKMAITLLEYGANPNVKDKHGNSAIHYAIQGNLSNTLELLLQHNCDIDAANNQGETPLIKSLTRRNEQMAMHLLQFKLNFNAKDNFGNSPMHYAVEGNLEKTSETLLKLECDFDCCNLQGETPLIKAIKRQNQEMANTLLSLGANPNTKDKYGNSVMHFAAQENLVNTVDELLVLESDFDYFNKEGETPLLKAVMRRNEDIAIKLLKHGAKPNAQDKYGNSVMHFAAEENLAITVDLLLSLECDFDNFNKDGETPLLKAVKRRNEQIAIKLLEHGANPNLKDANGYSVIYRAVWMELPLLLGYLLKCNCDLDNTGKGETPLMYAITNHKEDVAIQLLEHGANPICGKCGNSAMHYAVLESLPRLLEWLLKSGDNVDVENDVGCTPLMNALSNRNEDMAIRLLQYGASHNSKSDKPVLHYYCEKNLANIVEYLLKSNWDIEVCNNLGETPLVRAVKCGNDEMAMKLIQHGANPNAQDRSGNSVLHYAVLNNLSKFVRCILKLGCNVNIPNAMGSTPLRYALRNHNENMAIILLEHGANPNTEDKSGNSVLHYAVMGNLTRLVACLLKSGCKTNIPNGIGWTPLRYAVLNRNEEIAIQLLENGANPNASDKSGNSVMHYINRSNLRMLQQWFLNKNSEEKELH